MRVISFITFLAFVTATPTMGQEISRRLENTARHVQDLGGKLVPPPMEPAYRILRYLEMKDTSEQLVMITGGRNQGVVEGAVFKSYRRAPSPTGKPGDTIWVETGTLKALQVATDYTIATILGQETLESKAFFAKHPGIMAGDWVIEHKVTLSAQQVVTPSATLAYADLFEDPKAFPMTFELTERGKNILRDLAARFSDRRVPALIVEAYTDQNGPEDANQIESQQRAMAIRQFLIDELGFNPDRVLPVGFGEGDPIGKTFVPGYIEKNRRIVIKVKDLPMDITSTEY